MPASREYACINVDEREFIKNRKIKLWLKTCLQYAIMNSIIPFPAHKQKQSILPDVLDESQPKLITMSLIILFSSSIRILSN